MKKHIRLPSLKRHSVRLKEKHGKTWKNHVRQFAYTRKSESTISTLDNRKADDKKRDIVLLEHWVRQKYRWMTRTAPPMQLGIPRNFPGPPIDSCTTSLEADPAFFSPEMYESQTSPGGSQPCRKPTVIHAPTPLLRERR